MVGIVLVFIDAVKVKGNPHTVSFGVTGKIPCHNFNSSIIV